METEHIKQDDKDMGSWKPSGTHVREFMEVRRIYLKGFW